MMDVRIFLSPGRYASVPLPSIPSVGHGIRTVRGAGYMVVTAVLWDMSGPAPVVWIETRPPARGDRQSEGMTAGPG